MTERSPEQPAADDLLWQVSDLEVDESREGSLSDELLRAYRAGDLERAQMREVERRLAGHRADRRRLLSLARVEPDGPPKIIRERVLRQVSRSNLVAAPKQRPRRIRRWLAAAMVLTGVVSVALLTLNDAPWSRSSEPRPERLDSALPSDLSYRLSVTGIAGSRESGAGRVDVGPDSVGPAEAVDALPGTRLVFELTPLSGAIAGLEVGLFSDSDGRLTPLHQQPGVEIQMERGAAFLRAPARDLLGDRSGVVVLWVVVARQGDLPSDAPVPVSGDVESWLRGDGRRLVFQATVDYRTSDEPSHGETNDSEVER